LRAIYPVFRLLFPNQVIRADDLARTMVDVAVRDVGADREAIVLENREIRNFDLRRPGTLHARRRRLIRGANDRFTRRRAERDETDTRGVVRVAIPM
jgi:hypothetical protein